MNNADLLEKRVTMMQQEIHGALKAVSSDMARMNEDFHAIIIKVMGALQAMDARLVVLERALPNAKPVIATEPRDPSVGGIEL